MNKITADHWEQIGGGEFGCAACVGLRQGKYRALVAGELILRQDSRDVETSPVRQGEVFCVPRSVNRFGYSFEAILKNEAAAETTEIVEKVASESCTESSTR